MEVLSISQEVASHLLALHSLSPEHIAKMAKVFIKSLLTGEALTALDDSWKAPCDALGILLIEAVRTQSTEAQLKSLLSEHGISGEVADTITTAYSQYHDLLAKHLQKIGIQLPRLVGVEWRLDYAIRSKILGKENVPLFFVGLKVKEGKEEKDIRFLATLEEMQDLLAKVRDAVKQVERVIHLNES